MPDPIPQTARIVVINGEVFVRPTVRDIFLDEEVEWFCAEQNWEVAFVNDGSGEPTSPFVSEAFGPGLSPPPGLNKAEVASNVATVEFARYLSGPITDDARDGQMYSYQARVSGFAPRTARVRVFRRVRPPTN
jgi:hypothetical protein